MARPSTTYEPRQPASSVLYQVVRDHFETFRAQAADLRDGEGLPSFVEQEFRSFLQCGALGGGFARFRCTGCEFDRLVPLSCHGRGFCPSCGGRRMAERAAHLIDHVFPRVPVRQWVLSLPHRLRYRLACGAVTIVQRFGAALNTNIHFHVFVLDGVFEKDDDDVRFHPSPSLKVADVDEARHGGGVRPAPAGMA